jgi:hypothetical protein
LDQQRSRDKTILDHSFILPVLPYLYSSVQDLRYRIVRLFALYTPSFLCYQSFLQFLFGVTISFPRRFFRTRDGTPGRNHCFFYVAGTARTSIDLIDLCDVDPDHPLSPAEPYCLKTDWREQIAACIADDILYDHPALPALKLLLLTHARFKLMRRADNSVDDNCNRQTTFKLKMTETIGQGKILCIAVRLYEPDMVANQLSFHGAMPKAVLTSSLFPSAGRPPSPEAPSPATRSIPPAPTKVHVNEVLGTKRFTTPDIPSLSNTADIQRWYTVLHSRALVCGIYTCRWKPFTKASPMGVILSLACLTPTVMGRVGIMSAALHALLSWDDIFKGSCTALGRLVHRWRRLPRFVPTRAHGSPCPRKYHGPARAALPAVIPLFCRTHLSFYGLLSIGGVVPFF